MGKETETSLKEQKTLEMDYKTHVTIKDPCLDHVLIIASKMHQVTWALSHLVKIVTMILMLKVNLAATYGEHHKRWEIADDA